MICNDVDMGAPTGRVIMAPTTGVDVGSGTAYSSPAPFVWANGGKLETEAISWLVRAWQGRGGNAADSLASLRLLLRQLVALAQNPDMQPVYFRFGSTTNPGDASAVTEYDGWYYIDEIDPDYKNAFRQGNVPLARVAATLTKAAGPTPPEPLSMLYDRPLDAFDPQIAWFGLPIGSAAPIQEDTGLLVSRVGVEGTIPCASAGFFLPDPTPFGAPASIDSVFDGGVTVWDTRTAGANAVNTAALTNSNWLQLYGPTQGFTGDLILTNGLVMMRLNQGGSLDFWLWNTQGTPGGSSTPVWVQVGTLNYRDSGLNTATVSALRVERVGLRDSRIVARMRTSIGHIAELAFDLDAGMYHVQIEWKQFTEQNIRGLGLELVLTTAIKYVANVSFAVDVALQGTTNLTSNATQLDAVGIGTTTNQPLVGLLWSVNPDTGAPLAQSTTELGFGETTRPAQIETRTYGIFGTPFANVPNLSGQAESGTLDAGWTSVADAGSSGGNAAKCASGTVSGRAARWGTSYVPPPFGYDLWVYMRVASVASSTPQIQIGLWDVTSSAFVASTTYAPNNAALGTGYKWVKVCSLVVPTATHNMQVRAVTTATTTTDIFVDQHVLVPQMRQPTIVAGLGDGPRDISFQMLGRRRCQLLAG